MINNKDVQILRDLAKQTLEIASQPIQDERRSLWRDFNSLKTYRVPVYILDPQGMWREVFSHKNLKCEDELFRHYENWLHLQLYHASFGDDYIVEPFINIRPEYANTTPNWGSWGVSNEVKRIHETLAYHLNKPPVVAPEDLQKLIAPTPVIDRAKTEQRKNKLEEAIGDIIRVELDTFPPCISGLSYLLAYLLGPEEMLYQFYDQPDMVHEISGAFRDNAIKICDEAEKSGLYSNCDGVFPGNPQTQAMAYCHELPEPGQRHTVSMAQHWIYDCSQEFECVSPEMYYEFVLSYQIPVYEKFGLTSYGCCESLTKKIPYLKKLKNLRRIAVTPWANDEECASQIEDKYIVSWRPNPSEMVMSGFDAERIAGIVRRTKNIYESHGCHWEVNLKDFISVEHDPDRLRKWVSVVRETLES